jgi:hypothetical protein
VTPAAGERPSAAAIAAVAGATAALAFTAYRLTLLPGLDFGDTAAFQDAGGSLTITPRQAYPLYFAVGNLVVWSTAGEPAFGMNLASAICGALACGVIAWLAACVTGTAVGGLFTGLLFAGSYTFWSQAVIAEVYALHVLMLAASLLALWWWAQDPASLRRLALFFGVYALGFGNHLMMVLLAPAAVLFLAVTIPGGPRTLLSPPVVFTALACAALGALQYLWNFASVRPGPVALGEWPELLQTFWYDVTKSDWRASMVLGVHESALRPRAAMYWFDLRQQFGSPGVALAFAGAVWMARRDLRLFALCLAAYVLAMGFAYTYNVGDAHVFFLPSHVFVALWAGCGAAAVATRAAARLRLPHARAWLLAVLVAYPAWRVYDTWPAVDRSGDTRPERLVREMTAGLLPEGDLLIADLNWQLQNGLDYHARHQRAELLYTNGAGRLLTLPWLIADTLASGRAVVVTPQTRHLLQSAYGPLYAFHPDPRVEWRPLADRLRALPRGSVYVLALLRAYADLPLDAGELAAAAAVLTGETATVPTDNVYTIVAGRIGERPQLVQSEARPFRTTFREGGLTLDIRMESWLPPDTMRRAGFGHVIANRRHALTLERGVNVVAFDAGGQPRVEYASNLFAPQPRFVLRQVGGS